MIRTVVVDDEQHSRDVICNILKDHCSDIEIVATADSVNTASYIIRTRKPDLVFLDVELGDGSGFDLFDEFKNPAFKVIFITAFSEYAVRAFRFSAVDYLLKPIEVRELQEAIEKVKMTSFGISFSESLSFLLRNLRSDSTACSILIVPHIKGFEVLRVSEIIMCKADGYCTNFHLTGGRKIISSKNLKHYEELLEPQNFQRVHHSYIVNNSYVCGYNKQGEITLHENNIAFLGDAYKSSFMKKFLNR